MATQIKDGHVSSWISRLTSVTPTGMLYSAATAAAPARAKAEASTARASELIFDIIAVQLRLFDFEV